MEESVVYHVPVMLQECLNGLNIHPDGVYVDLTFGGGGHSKAILEQLGPKGRLLSFDQDLDAMENIMDDARFTFVRSNFCYLYNFLRYYGVDKVDGVLADLGVSSHHLDDDARGFSFRFDGVLDMRMNQRAMRTAADVLNSYDEESLANVFYYYGELTNARKLARVIVKERELEPFSDIARFIEVMKVYFPREREKKDMARLFQALRIEVNREMEVLKRMLTQVPEVLADDGRFVVMTYHSLEDRLVKNFMKTGNFEGKAEKDFYGKVVAPLKMLSNKVITASDEELVLNPRSRSAKLRVAVKNS